MYGSNYSSTLLKVWLEPDGSLRASVYVGVDYRRSFMSFLPDWLEKCGVWTGKPDIWACRVLDSKVLGNPFPAVRLYFILIDSLAGAMRFQEEDVY